MEWPCRSRGEQSCRDEVSRRVRTPGGTLIMAAHRELESLCLDRQTRQQKDILRSPTLSLFMKGTGIHRCARRLDAFFAKTQETVTGSVTLRYKGNMTVVSRKSPFSLYGRTLRCSTQATTTTTTPRVSSTSSDSRGCRSRLMAGSYEAVVGLKKRRIRSSQR
jgi:argininosuccinate synthase